MKKRSFNRHTYYVIVHIVKLWFFHVVAGFVLWFLINGFPALYLLAQDKLTGANIFKQHTYYLDVDAYGWFIAIYVYSAVLYLVTGFLAVKERAELNYGVLALLISMIWPMFMVQLTDQSAILYAGQGGTITLYQMGHKFTITDDLTLYSFLFLTPISICSALLGMKAGAEYRERFYTTSSRTEKPEEITVEPPYPTRI